MPAEPSTPATPTGRAGLAALLAEPARALVGLDFDGTLSPIVADPAEARAHPGAVAALGRLAAHGVGLAVITGRPAAVAVELGGFASARGLDDLVVLGHYGLERWEAATGQVVAPPPPPGVAAARRDLPDVLERAGVPAQIEDKGSSLAVHTRRLADPQAGLDALRAPLTALAGRHDLVVEPGRFVLELRPPGTDKGAALQDLVDQRQPASLAFAGDDLGDLAAFDVVDALRRQGTPGLLVCSDSGGEVAALAERADLVVAGPPGVVALLDELADRLSRARPPGR